MEIIIFLLLCRISMQLWPTKSCKCLMLSARVNIIVENVENELNSWTLIHFVSILYAWGFWYFILVKCNVLIALVTFVLIYLIVLIVENILLLLNELGLRVLKIRFLKILISLATIRIVGIQHVFLRKLYLVFVLKYLCLLILHLKL